MRASTLALALLALLVLLGSGVDARAHHRHRRSGSSPARQHSHLGKSPADLGAPLAASDPSPLCQTCQTLVQSAYEATQNASSMAALKAALQAGCATASSPLVCDLLVDALVKELPKLPDKIHQAGMYTPAIVCSFLSACSVPCCDDNRPSQVHLSVSGSALDSTGRMTVTWITLDDGAELNMRWGTDPNAMDQTATAGSTRWYDAGGWKGRIHSGEMTNLTRGAEYYYQVGGDSTGWSALTSFTAPATVLPPGYAFLLTGDMGAELNFSAGNQAWINFASAGKNNVVAIDTVIHIGDIGYADGYEERTDMLFRALEPTASRMPYQTVGGNHECMFNFSSYKARFSMPTASSGAPSDGMYYSWDAGCIHWVALHTESVIDTPEITSAQVAWLQKDLQTYSARKAQAAKRGLSGGVECSAEAPQFLAVYLHRPMYCSAGNSQGVKRCQKEGAYLRGQVESLLQQHQADVVLAGHVHAYERTINMFNNQVDPSGPIYILNGAGGNREGQSSKWLDPLPSWSASRSAGPGLGTLRVVNGTALHWQFFLQQDLVQAMQSGAAPMATDETYIFARV